MTVEGFLSGGGSSTMSFLGLSTATTESLNWTDLTSVSTDDAGLDDIVDVPEPGPLALLALGLAGLGIRRHRERAPTS